MSVGSQPSVVETEAPEPLRAASQDQLSVCHIASGDRWAGAEVQLAALLSGLRGDPSLRLSAIFLNEGRLAQTAREFGITTRVFDESRQNFFHILSAAAPFIRENNVQVLHSHRYKENLLAALLARRCHIPVHVSTRHGAPEPFHGLGAYKQRLIQAVDRQVALHSVDSIVSVSDDLRTQLARQLPGAKIALVHNGIDETAVFSRLSAAQAKQRLGILPASFVIGTAGRLDPIKRLDIFLNAANQIVGDYPDSKFILVGKGDEESHLRQMAADLGIGDRVFFLGHRDDVYDVMRAFDIFVLCSDHEGLPMALLEALRLGVPVVARPVGGIPEVIQEGVSGVFVPSPEPRDLASACLSLLCDASRRALLAKAGSDLVANKFSARQTAAEMAALYRSLIPVAQSASEPRTR